MAMNRAQYYGTRWESPSDQSPQGKFKNKSSETAVDGSYLEKHWINDMSGFSGALLNGYIPTQSQLDAINPLGFENNGIIGTPADGVVDEANASQVYNAWYKHTQEVADGRIADKQIEEKIAELETLAEGCWFTYYSGGGVTGTLTGKTTITDFNFNDSASSSTKFLNSHQISVTGDGTEITFIKAGMYAVKPVFLVESNLDLDNSVFQIQTKTPNGNYTNYTGESKVSTYRFVDMLDGVSYTNRTVNCLVDSTRISAGTSFKTGLSFALTQSDFLIAAPVDGTSMKFKIKILDDTGAGANFNFQFSMQRIGKYISNYTLPTDILAAP